MTIFDEMLAVSARVVELQDAQVRSLALRLLGEDVGDPNELMRRLQENIRRFAGQDASLVWCVVNEDALPPGVSHESYLAIDTGKPNANPVRIGPVMTIRQAMPYFGTEAH